MLLITGKLKRLHNLLHVTFGIVQDKLVTITIFRRNCTAITSTVTCLTFEMSLAIVHAFTVYKYTKQKCTNK